MAMKRPFFFSALGSIIILFLISCPLLAQSEQFINIAASAGVNSGGKSNGVAFGDYNNDGFIDIYITRSNGAGNLLFKNNGDATFSNTTLEAGLAGLMETKMALWADFDNDGNKDLFMISFSRGNFLFYNNGDGTFVDISESAGVARASKGVAAAVADIDNDGFLDIYIANFSEENILYRNNGRPAGSGKDMVFTDMIQQSGALDQGYAMGIQFCDFDNDGDQDLLLSHDGDAGNRLYQNDGTGVFKDVASAANVKFSPMGMGVGFGDYNNDGHFDLYVTVLGPNLLYRNDGNGRYSLMPFEPRFADDRSMGWGVTWFDYDNDSFLDLYVANQSDFPPPMPNVLYHNAGDGSFTLPDNSSGTASMAASYGSACADVNNDGSLDLFVTNDRDADELYLNRGGGNNWLQVHLIGTTSNRDAVGARLRVDAGGLTCYREISAGGGFISQNSAVQHFGLADKPAVDSLTIRWPSGVVGTYFNIQVNQRITITENVGIVTAVEENENPGALPSEFALQQNYPNPFNPSTMINFQLATDSEMRLSIYSIAGQLVRTLVAGKMPAGQQSVRWDGRDNAGNAVASGAYIVKMATPQFVTSRKIMLMK